MRKGLSEGKAPEGVKVCETVEEVGIIGGEDGLGIRSESEISLTGEGVGGSNKVSNAGGLGVLGSRGLRRLD